MKGLFDLYKGILNRLIRIYFISEATNYKLPANASIVCYCFNL